MILVCHVISEDHVIKGRVILWVGPPHGKSAMFGAHNHCGSGDIMFSVAEEEDSKYCRFNPPLLFVSKGRSLKAHGISY